MVKFAGIMIRLHRSWESILQQSLTALAVLIYLRSPRMILIITVVYRLSLALCEPTNSFFKLCKITPRAAEEALKGLNRYKATGYDFLPPKALEYGLKEMALPLATLHKTCIK